MDITYKDNKWNPEETEDIKIFVEDHILKTDEEFRGELESIRKKQRKTIEVLGSLFDVLCSKGLLSSADMGKIFGCESVQLSPTQQET